MDEREIKRRAIFGVGYGKPPERNQFKKGQSGNPKGRPRSPLSTISLNDQSTLTAVLAIAGKSVTVREGGDLTEMSLLDAVLSSTASSAVKGNPRSQAIFLGLSQKADAARALRIRESNETWANYKHSMSARLAAAVKRGEPVPQILPHPDDIIIDPQRGSRFLGPMEETSQRMMEATIRYRDVLIMQDELDHRSSIRLDGTRVDEPGAAGMLAHLLEQAIPPRLRLSDTQWLMRAMQYESMPKRVLLKRLFEAWKQLGSPYPRGFVFPDVSLVRDKLKLMFQILRQLRKLDVARMSEQDLAEAILAISDEWVVRSVV